MRNIIIITIIGLLLMAGCTNNEEPPKTQSDPSTEQPNQEKPVVDDDKQEDKDQQSDNQGGDQSDHQEDEQSENEDDLDSGEDQSKDQVEVIDIEDYLPKANQQKFLKGIGNEFAQEEETFYEQEGEYLPSILENGGTRILNVYKLTEKGLFVVFQLPEYYEDEIPSIESIKSQFKEKPLLLAPLKEGYSFGEWKITHVDETVTVPLGEINEVIVLEAVNDDGSISRQYWAKNFGLIKKEFVMKHKDGAETVVTSELEKIETLNMDN